MTDHEHPRARRLDLTENLAGHEVSDPYRWLEDPASPERAEWLSAENELFEAYSRQLPARQHFAARVGDYLAVGSVGTPAWRGNRCFFTRRGPGQGHAVLYTQLPGGGPVPLIDPMAIDPSGLTTLDAWQPDKEGRLLAYQLSQGGDEESLLRVLDVTTGALVDGPIDRCRYSNIAWLPGGKAFYYTRRLPSCAVPDGESQYHRRVYLHQIGTPADEQDVLIFGEGRDKTNYYYASVSRDGRWLTISAAQGTAPRNDLWLADLASSDPAAPELTVVQEGVDAQTAPWVGRDGRLYLQTDSGAPRGKIAVADPADPGQRNWQDLIQADPEAVLADYAILDGPELDRPVLIVSWTRHAVSEVSMHDLRTGELLSRLPLPGLGTLGGFSERPEGGHEAWAGDTDYTTPATVLRFDAAAGQVEVWARPPGSTPVPAVTARQVAFESKDGTVVRMLIVAASDADADEAGAREPGAARRCQAALPRPAAARGRRSCTATAGSTSASRPRTRRTSSPGSRQAASTRSPTCAAAPRKARNGTGPGCSTASRTYSTTSRPRHGR